MIPIRPGTAVSLVVNTNFIREINDIRNSVVYDQQGKKIILAQTEPLLLSDQVGKVIVVSYLVQEKGKPIRYGIKAQVFELLREYPLNPLQNVPAVVVVALSRPEPYNLRMYYRIRPPSEYGLGLYLFDQPVIIIDISIGGAVIAAPARPAQGFHYEIGESIPLTLTVDEEIFSLKGKIKRISDPEDQRQRRDQKVLAMEFCDRTPQIDRSLGEKILNIQREWMARGLEP